MRSFGSNPKQESDFAQPEERDPSSAFAFLDWPLAALALTVGIGYYTGAMIGFALTFYPNPVSVMWPPNSILLAALSLTPVRVWWLLLLAAFPFHVLIQWQSGVPAAMTLCWFISNCVEALIGAAGMRWWLKQPLHFGRLRHLGAFFLFGAFLGPFLSSFLDASLVMLNQWGKQGFWQVWEVRLASNTFAVMTIVPAIVTWCERRPVHRELQPGRRAAEVGVVVAGLLITSGAAFLSKGGLFASPTFVYLPLPFLLWAAIRFGPRGASTAILTVALVAIWGAVHGRGPFSSQSAQENASSLQLFLIVMTSTLLPLSTVLGERKKAVDALKASEARYREVVEAQTELLCRLRTDSTLTFVNAAFCRFFGKGREELIGQRFADLLSSAGRATFIEETGALNPDRPSCSYDLEMTRADGSLGWLHWAYSAVFDPDGRIVEYQAIGHDITDRRYAEEAKQNLIHASRLAVVGELTAMVAHEINQPLGAILSNAEAAEILLKAERPRLDEVRQILADIRKNDLRADEAIRRIRALLRKRDVQMDAVDLNETILDVLRLVHGDARRRRIQIRKKLDPSLPRIFGDRVQLQQVALNLIVNSMDAMDATRDRARVLTIETKPFGGDYAEVIVSDSGPGIASEKVHRVFDSFFTTKKEGMGLGLSIARSIIEAHQGKIRAETRPQGGARFRFTIPYAKDDSSGDLAGEMNQVATGKSNGRDTVSPVLQ